MEELRNLFPGIVSVEYFNAALLSEEDLNLAAMTGQKIEIPEDRFEIPLIEPGTCEVTSKDGAESLSLKFSAQIKIYPRFRLAILIKDANGSSWLIASSSRPYPHLSMLRTYGSLPDQRPQVSYEITHTAIHTPIEVLIDADT